MSRTEWMFRSMDRYVVMISAFDNVQLNCALRVFVIAMSGDARRRAPERHPVPDTREARTAGPGLRPLLGRQSGPTRGGASAPRSGALRPRGARGRPPCSAGRSASSHVRTGGIRPCASARVDRKSRLAVPASLRRAPPASDPFALQASEPR
jgi:hypothetical protein